MNSQRIGYVRVSSFDQNPERQVWWCKFCEPLDTGTTARYPHLPPLGWEHINLTGDYNCLPANQWLRPHG